MRCSERRRGYFLYHRPAKTRKNTFFAWISIKQMNKLA